MKQLEEQIPSFYDKKFDITASSSAEVVIFGDKVTIWGGVPSATMPPAAKFERIELVSKMVREFGPVGMGI